MTEDYPDHAAANAIIPAPAVVIQPAYAMVEIFGHRSHYGEIREVEAFGAKLLEVTDADTGKTHRYGGASIFSLTMLSQAEFDAHVADRKRRKEEAERYERQYKIEREAREARWAEEESVRRAMMEEPAPAGQNEISF